MSCYRGSHDKDYSPEGEGWSDWRRWCNGRRVNNHSNQEDTVEIFPTPVWSLWPLGWMSLIMSSFETSLTLILKCFWAWLHATLLESCCFVIYVFFVLFLIIALTLWMQLQHPLLFSFFEVAGGMKGCLVVAWPVWWFHGEGKEAAQESIISREGRGGEESGLDGQLIVKGFNGTIVIKPDPGVDLVKEPGLGF